MDARKGFVLGKFWDWLAYSRVMSWGREFLGMRAYLVRNELEALGRIPYRRRERKRRAKATVILRE